MNSHKSILFIGHSHIECITAAIRKNSVKNAYVLNIHNMSNATGEPNKKRTAKTIDRAFKEKERPHQEFIAKIINQSPISNPDVICLCVDGNEHNILGIIENPTPFSIGEKEQGSAPNDVMGRHFIPYQLMKEYFKERMHLDLIPSLFMAFPNAKKLYMNAPPPISDWEHIKAHPGVFRDKIEIGPAPNSLRMQLYRIQSEIFRNAAEVCQASFIEVNLKLIEDTGFLSPLYYNADPTHGNVAYGEIMLNEILERT